MNRLTRALIALGLALLMLLPLCATAFAASMAEGPEDLRLRPYSFPSDQYYENKEGNVQALSIQVAAGLSCQGAINRANALVANGLDGFVYADKGMYYVMCGKFGSDYDALCYAELIHTDPAEASAYMVAVSLPQDAIKTFQSIFYHAVRVNPDSKVMESYWEKPSGAFFRGDDEEEELIEVYTVQFSKGSCFTRSESLRDRMERSGYPAFVYKINLSYKIMTGMFLERNDAKRYCKLIRRNTKEKDAVVKSAFVPKSEYESFVEWWSKQ